MNRFLLPALMLVTASSTAAAETVEIAALGSLQLDFEQAVRVEVYPGQPVAAEVTFRTGEAYSVPSPGRVQQIEYLMEPGVPIAKGQPFAVLRGPEMHHVEMNYESSSELAAVVERRFKSNKALYARQAISESQWLEISEQYYAVMLEYEHMRHFFELVVSGDNDPDALTLAAPLTGLIDYRSAANGVAEGDSIARFVPAAAVRLHAALPIAISNEVASLRAGDCQLVIERVSAVTDGFFVQAWTQALPSQCHLMLGQQVLAIPQVRVNDGYRIPRTAVFQLQRESYVLIRRGDSLVSEAVSLLGSEGDDYLVRANTTLDGAEVLVSSVSAVQGILLGLGGE
jgi:hypothetical protein